MVHCIDRELLEALVETESFDGITSIELLKDETLEFLLQTKAGNNIDTIPESQLDE